MRHFKLFLFLFLLILFGCKDEDSVQINPSELAVSGQTYSFAGGYLTNFGLADSNASSPYSGTKIQLDLYTNGLFYDRDNGFEGEGFLVKLQLFSANSFLQEGNYSYRRDQLVNTYDNALIIEYPESGNPSALYPSDYGQLTLTVLAGGQVQLSGAFIVNERDVTFNYVGAFATYP
jgi:hypothetical protein